MVAGTHALLCQTPRGPARPDAEPMKVYPNPSTGKFTVEVRAQDHLFDVNVYNLMGEMIFHWESAGTGAAVLEVDLTKRPDGLYFVELDTEKANVLRRIVLERQQ